MPTSTNENKVLQIADYMKDNNMLDEYLAIVISEDSGKRIMEVVYNSYWCSFFNDNGNFRETYDFCNQKEEVKIGEYCKSAIRYYLSVTGCNPSRKQYIEKVFPHLTRSKVSKSLKKASEELAIDTYKYVPLLPLKKDGTEKKICCYNKQKGKKSEVYPFEIEDIKKMTEYFSNNGMWLHYMMFVLSCNMARRVGDMLSLKWENFFDPKTGNFRDDILEIQEDKTDKLANPRINSACRAAIKRYIEKTGCDVTKNNYTVPVFMQLTGTHKGTVLSDSGYLKSFNNGDSVYIRSLNKTEQKRLNSAKRKEIYNGKFEQIETGH